MDWQSALIELGLRDQDWGPMYRGTYAELAAGWRGVKPLPSEAELLAAKAIADTRPPASEARDPLTEIDAIKAALVKKAVVTQAEIDAEKAARAK